MNTLPRIAVCASLALSATAAQAAPAKQAPKAPTQQQIETARIKHQAVAMAKTLLQLQRENEELKKQLASTKAPATVPTPSTAPTRRILSRAIIEGQKTVERVEAVEIGFPPHFQAGLHLHACPVVGRITAGAILFQIEGQPPQTLQAGDTFLEPANARILHFDSIGDGPATFTAFYLAGKDDQELVTMLPKTQN